MAKREYRHDEPNPNDGETTLRLVLSDDGTFVYSPPDDPSQRHEFLLEEEKFQRSLNIKPSKLVK